jgi:hypothetical protein
MSKLDLAKEQIGWLKVLFGIVVAADLSVLGWLAQNVDSAPSVAAVVAVIVASYIGYRINKNAYRKMKRLEKM